MNNRPYRVIDLEQPIIEGSGRNQKTHRAITIRQPVARDLRNAARAKTTVEAMLCYIAGTSGLPMKVVEQLSEPDFNKCMDFYAEIGSIQIAATDASPATEQPASPTFHR